MITFLGATKDISDRKKIEEDLVQRNLDYEKLNKNGYHSNLELSHTKKLFPYLNEIFIGNKKFLPIHSDKPSMIQIVL